MSEHDYIAADFVLKHINEALEYLQAGQPMRATIELGIIIRAIHAHQEEDQQIRQALDRMKDATDALRDLRPRQGKSTEE